MVWGEGKGAQHPRSCYKKISCIRMPSLRTYRLPLGLLLKFQRLVVLRASACRPGCGVDSNVRIVGCKPWIFSFTFLPRLRLLSACPPPRYRVSSISPPHAKIPSSGRVRRKHELVVRHVGTVASFRPVPFVLCHLSQSCTYRYRSPSSWLQIRGKTARSNAVVLEMIGDLPDADMKPPENVLFVCKLNPVTTDDDLEIIFTR